MVLNHLITEACSEHVAFLQRRLLEGPNFDKYSGNNISNNWLQQSSLCNDEAYLVQDPK